MAGNSRDALVEDNTFTYSTGASDTCWLWGTNSSNDNDKAGFQRMMVRRNRFVGGGNTQAEIAGCSNCTFENNIFTTEHAGARGFASGSIRTRSPQHYNAIYGGSCNPALAYGATACDDQNTGLQIRNNTFHRAGTATNYEPDPNHPDGNGPVVANNASWFGGATGNSCYSVESPAALPSLKELLPNGSGRYRRLGVRECPDRPDARSRVTSHRRRQLDVPLAHGNLLPCLGRTRPRFRPRPPPRHRGLFEMRPAPGT